MVNSFFKCKTPWVAILGAALVASVFSSASLAQSGRITVATGPASTFYNQVATAVSNQLQQELGVASTARPFGGTTIYLPQLHRGDIALGLNSALDSGAAYLGEEPYPQALSNVRAAMLLFRAPYALHARGDSTIETIADLKGKPVITAYRSVVLFQRVHEVLLATAGLTPDDIKPVEAAGVADAVRSLVEGRVAAAGSITNIGLLREADASVSGGLRVLALGENEAALEQLAGFTATTLKPGPASVGVTKPMRVAQFDVYLNTSSKHAADDVYRQVKAIHQNWGKLQKEVPGLRGADAAELAPANISHPYHEGAVRYFKEVGLWTDKHERRQQEMLKKAAR
jgi:TRAP transporter TAXI family solute receptor